MLLPMVSLSNLTRIIQPLKNVGGGAILVLGLISVRVKYCDPTEDLGKVSINLALN